MISNYFHSITFFPNGQVYDANDWLISDLVEYCPLDIVEAITLDSVKRKKVVVSPIGELEFVWSASNVFGVSTLLRSGVTVNTALFLPGLDFKEETTLLEFYLNSWRNFSVVKELCGDDVPFRLAENSQERPLLVSINWSTIAKEDYDKIAYYDLFIASKYFQMISNT